MSHTPGYQRFFAELKRRQVFRVMAIYGAASFALIEAADVIFPRLGFPDWTVTLFVWLCLLGFPLALILAWAFELTPDGLKLDSAVDRSQAGAPGAGRAVTAARRMAREGRHRDRGSTAPNAASDTSRRRRSSSPGAGAPEKSPG